MSRLVSPSEWEAQYKDHPGLDNMIGYTQVTCIHAVHGTVTFYLSPEQFQDVIRPLLTPYWINSFTIVITSMA